VRDFDELQANAKLAKGRIVVYNQTCPNRNRRPTELEELLKQRKSEQLQVYLHP